MGSASAISPSRFPWLDPSKYSFSLGVEAAGTAWLSGQTASVHRTDVHRTDVHSTDGHSAGRVVVEGDPATQAALCWEKIGAVLEGSGRTPEDCTELVEYLTSTGLQQREAIAATRPTARAASTMVVESLVRPDAHVELEVVAGGPAGQIRLPQVLPLDEAGDIVAPGDLVGQSAFVLEQALRLLADEGLDGSNIVRVVQATTPATRSQYRGTAEARRRLLGPVFPSSTGVLTSALPHPDALVALDVWASPHPKTVVPHAVDAYRDLTFAPAVVAGDVVYISGTTAWNPETGDTVGPGDMAAQAEYIYDQIDQVCRAAGGSISDVVKTIEYVTPEGLDQYRVAGPIRQRMFDQPLPASTGVVVAGLLSRQWVIEVEAVAVLS